MSSDILPEKTRVDFFRGDVWIDLEREQVFCHGLLKTEIGAVLGGLSHGPTPGLFLPNGVLLTNESAELSGHPDGHFVTNARIKYGRIAFPPGRDGGFTEIVGSADMVLEVVSPGSVYKDTERLREAYFAAGVTEYWIADGRGEEPTLTILKRGSRGYTEVRRVGDWLKSGVFVRSFRLTSSPGYGGHPQFSLEHK